MKKALKDFVDCAIDTTVVVFVALVWALVLTAGVARAETNELAFADAVRERAVKMCEAEARPCACCLARAKRIEETRKRNAEKRAAAIRERKEQARRRMMRPSDFRSGNLLGK